MKLYLDIIKPISDLLLALILLICLAPFLLLLYIILLAVGTEKPIFTQERPGKDEQIFKLYKFRTMNEKRDEDGNLLPDAQRLTSVGRILRKSSLDELPQLINVLSGKMSFVGPRPLLVSYLKLYDNQQRLRHSVKPGITGWAQVNGRNNISWNEKFELDLYYVKNVSLALDMKIIMKTILNVFKGKNIRLEQAFEGNRAE